MTWAFYVALGLQAACWGWLAKIGIGEVLDRRKRRRRGAELLRRDAEQARTRRLVLDGEDIPDPIDDAEPIVIDPQTTRWYIEAEFRV